MKYYASLKTKLSRAFKKAKRIMHFKSNGDFSIENRNAGATPSNVFLLTHKCGINYVQDVFRRSNKKLIHFQTDELKEQMPGPYISEDINALGGWGF